MQNTMVRGEGGIYSLGKKLELRKMGGKFAGGSSNPSFRRAARRKLICREKK